MVNMSAESREFLAKNLPEASNKDNARGILDLLYDLIDEKGFAPPHYYDYNDLGREAQRVYDDIYGSNFP